MHRTHEIAAAAFALTVAALPGLARADDGRADPQQEARIEQLIEQAIHGNIEADRQEQVRIDRLVRQALERAGVVEGNAAASRSGLLAQGSVLAPRH